MNDQIAFLNDIELDQVSGGEPKGTTNGAFDPSKNLDFSKLLAALDKALAAAHKIQTA